MNEPCRHEHLDDLDNVVRLRQDLQEARSTLEDFQYTARKALLDAKNEIAVLTVDVHERDLTIARMRTGRS